VSELSVLIGGKAGFGIDKASLIIASLVSRLGYRIYINRDYPSLIRGGHTFSIIRASTEKVFAHRDSIDVLLALNQETVEIHKSRLKSASILIYDSDLTVSHPITCVKYAANIPLSTIIKEEHAEEVMRNTCIIGAFAKSVGIEWDVLSAIIKEFFPKEIEQNLKVARRAFDAAKEFTKIDRSSRDRLPLVTGNEATALGLIRGGLESYISYPMTPTSPILHYLASLSEEVGVKVIHPESEISVIMMALGMAYCGEKVAVGTSGGGFCLMTEGLSFSGMAELPVVIVLGQRPGPSTGLPTYSCQTDLHFALNAGQGEFTRFVIAPGDAEEAYSAALLALNIAWKYQIPAIVLTDKAMGEGYYSFDMEMCGDIKETLPLAWDRKDPYKRYSMTETGISAVAFPSEKDAIIKVNSYEHDESGLSIEDAATTIKMQDKRLRKEKYLAMELEGRECVGVYGNKKSATALLCWGSNKGVCIEVADALGLKVIQPVVISPFPIKEFKKSMDGIKKLIAVENNATGQLARLIGGHGISVNETILKYDGRNFGVEELTDRVRKVIG